jgi:hypothetical protein
LLNVNYINLAEQANITGRIDGKKLHVCGAKNISAVIVVCLETRTRPFTSDVCSVSKSYLFSNPQAVTVLSDEDCNLLKDRINFDSIKWGPGWETWETPRGTKRKDNRNAVRLRRQGGQIMVKYLADGSFEIEIPVNLIARLLAVDISCEDIDKSYSEEVVKLLKRAIEQGQQVVGCNYISADPKSRDNNKILLRYGPPKSPIISDPNKQKK